MESRLPRKSTRREIVDKALEASAGMVPVAGPVFAVALVTALNWRLNSRRDEFLEGLAERLEELGERLDGFDPGSLADNPDFVSAVVSATRTVEHTHQEEKLSALRNAVLNSAMPGAPDADTQAYFLHLADQFTESHLRLLALWDDPAAWFSSHGLTAPQAAFITKRTLTVEAGLPELRGREDIYLLWAEDLVTAGLMNARLTGSVQPRSLMSRLTTDVGRQFVRFISPPPG